MSSPTSRAWRRLLAGAAVATLVGITAPTGTAGATEAPAALVPAQVQQPGAGSGTGTGSGDASGSGSGSGGSAGTGSGTGGGAGSGGSGSGSGGGSGGGTGSGGGAGSGSGGSAGGGFGGGAGIGGNGAGGAAADAAARAAAEREAAAKEAKEAKERQEAEEKAAREKAQAEKEAAEAAAKAAEEQREAEERAARLAAQQAAQAAKARDTWDRRGRPKKLIIVRQTGVDVVTNGASTRVARSGPLTLGALSRVVPNSFLSVDGDTATLNAAVVLTPGTTFDISGVKTLRLGGGDSPTEAAFLYTGSGRITVKGVTVTSVDENGQPLAMAARGRPYVVVSSRGRFDATDATLSDLGVQPTGTDKGEPGISFNTNATGALVRTTLLRNTTGAELSKSAGVRLDGVTAAESWSDGLLLQGDSGTVMTNVKAERNDGNGVTVTGDSTDRPITSITTTGNHSYGVAVIGQTKLQVNAINATGDGAGGLRVNRCTDCVVRDVTTADQPIGLFMHVNTTNATLEGLHFTGGRRAIVAEKTTKGATISNSTIDGARVAGVAIGGHDVALNGVSISDTRTAVRVERGAGNIDLTGLKLSGGQDGVVTTAGTTGVAIKDLVADGVRNDAIRNFSPGAQVSGGVITGGTTAIDAEAGTTISGTMISLSNEGIRARSNEPVTATNVNVDALAVGLNVAEGSVLTLSGSRVYALQSVRGVLDPAGTGNDLSLPRLRMLSLVGLPLIVLALGLEVVHSLRQRRFGGLRRPLPPALPAAT